ncbi:MAG: NAD(P)/FAD-dependent oxidoreductase [Caulobacteraceae bacterium]
MVIVGGGFGGLSAAKALAGARLDLVLVDRRNHHLFQPLLYQVATAGLAPTQIASPIRSILRGQENARVALAQVTGVDLAAREIILGQGRQAYDYLVLATGARETWFGHDEWKAFAPGLKTLEDAIGLRTRILLAFEKAEQAGDPDERRRLLTFVVVGGGPTGVELAGAIAELARRALDYDFQAIGGEMAKVILLEAGPRLLPTFSPRLSAYAAKALGRLRVEVRLGQAVIDCGPAGVGLGDGRIESRTVIWAAGVRASPAALWLGAQADAAGRAIVGPDLSIPGHPEVFVIGDASLSVGPRGRPTPGLAPAAKQQGAYVARLIRRDLTGKPRGPAFAYRDYGALATVGRKAAVVSLGRIELTGSIAWLFWCVAHIFFLIGFRNRVMVALDWLWAYFTFERGARLIMADLPVEAGASSSQPRPRSRRIR